MVTHCKPTRAEYAGRLAALRTQLEQQGVDGFIVPVTDAYQNEYPPASARRVAWLSGFTGSAGALVVLRESALDEGKINGVAHAKAAAAFVDGRYTLQARRQIDASYYEQCDLHAEPMAQWVTQRLSVGRVLAYDPWLHTQAQVSAMRETLEAASITLAEITPNPLDAIWQDRPAAPCSDVVVHGVEYAGEDSASKRNRVSAAVAENGADAVVITAPDSVAWLLNIRGTDVEHTPLVLSYAVLYRDGSVDWFIDENRISSEVRAHIGESVRIVATDKMPEVIDNIGFEGRVVQCDTQRSPAWFYQRLQAAQARIIEKDDPCLLPKACKNNVEIVGIRAAHVRDGVALCQFLHWLDSTAPYMPVTELDAEAKLLAFRQQQQGFRDTSFSTIAGSGEHGAIVHYRSTEETNQVLAQDSLFLLDSGAQYPDGTTDVTRTTVIGCPTAEQKRRFTQVLKGHIAIASACFPQGTNGLQLDTLARAPLWADGLDYAHGTGHGVGAYLGVHEGPQGIHPRAVVPLQPGMLISNEPGFYKEGEYGIRIENLVIVYEKYPAAANGRAYYAFETVTLAPIERQLIDEALLTPHEIAWLDGYHQRVYDTLAPRLDADTRQWLADKTAPIAAKAATTQNTDSAQQSRTTLSTHEVSA